MLKEVIEKEMDAIKRELYLTKTLLRESHDNSDASKFKYFKGIIDELHNQLDYLFEQFQN